jgi:hypothetical protein
MLIAAQVELSVRGRGMTERHLEAASTLEG